MDLELIFCVNSVLRLYVLIVYIHIADTYAFVVRGFKCVPLKYETCLKI